MTFIDITPRLSVFVDANVFLYAFTSHPIFGSACKLFLDRIANQELHGFTSSQILGEVIHRLMTIEASVRFGWPTKGIAPRLRQHPAEAQQLTRPTQAMDDITLIGLDILPVCNK